MYASKVARAAAVSAQQTVCPSPSSWNATKRPRARVLFVRQRRHALVRAARGAFVARYARKALSSYAVAGRQGGEQRVAKICAP